MAAPLPITKRTAFHGRTKQLTGVVKRGGAIVDISDAKFALTAKRDITDADVDAVFQVTTATFITDGTDGAFILEIPKEATDLIAVAGEPEELVYDIVVELDGKTYTLENGRLKVYPSPTRAEELV